MNDKDYSAIKKGMKEHITVTVQGDRDWKSFAKLDSGKWVAVKDNGDLGTGKWVAVKDNGDLGDIEILPDDLFTMLCIFRDLGRQVIFNDHSAV